MKITLGNICSFHSIYIPEAVVFGITLKPGENKMCNSTCDCSIPLQTEGMSQKWKQDHQLP